MEFINTEIDDVVIVKPKVFEDARGYFFETFVQKEFEEKVCKTTFVQDNQSKSSYGVLRGLHYQLPPFTQAKLVSVVKGNVLDVAVDIRMGSPTFGKYVAVELSGEDHLQLFIPRGFAHGFVVLSNEAVFQYKCDNYYSPQHEGAIIWNDAAIAINWQIAEKDIILSEKDKMHPSLENAKIFTQQNC
ncbi:MAG: dTDP-4-dehydrorhamnose 3,5-epimerase [Prevotellaceae bacterium]|jgi:dTDP-4-dehydrorhamnose 3,5-epimerase|nr:dTDP-4-dehydrorhamnose 3,5-epimerase [Prevotellaceae bacterium]